MNDRVPEDGQTIGIRYESTINECRPRHYLRGNRGWSSGSCARGQTLVVVRNRYWRGSRRDGRRDMKRPSMQIGLGIALGAGIGIAISVALGSGGAWLAIGIAIGVFIGTMMSRNRTEVRRQL